MGITMEITYLYGELKALRLSKELKALRLSKGALFLLNP